MACIVHPAHHVIVPLGGVGSYDMQVRLSQSVNEIRSLKTSSLEVGCDRCPSAHFPSMRDAKSSTESYSSFIVPSFFISFAAVRFLSLFGFVARGLLRAASRFATQLVPHVRAAFRDCQILSLARDFLGNWSPFRGPIESLTEPQNSQNDSFLESS